MSGICMVCGQVDCCSHYGYDYPIRFLEKMFGKKNDYSADLASLQNVEVEGGGREVYGHKFVLDANGFKIAARYENEQFDVRFVDPRLIAKGVEFTYMNGNKIIAKAPSSTPTEIEKSPKMHLGNQLQQEQKNCCTILGVQNLPIDEVLDYVCTAYETGSKQLVIDLSQALSNYFPAGDKRAGEVKDIEQYYHRGRISYETTLLLLSSYLPHVAEKGYRIPVGAGLYLTDKSKEELYTYLKTAAFDLYPKTVLHRQLSELLQTKLFGIFTRHVFKMSEHEVFKQYDWIMQSLI